MNLLVQRWFNYLPFFYTYHHNGSTTRTTTRKANKWNASTRTTSRVSQNLMQSTALDIELMFRGPQMGMPGYYPGPAAMPNFPPPLPAGWSEHNAPDGVTKYYYNSNTKESTYTRPSFAPLPQVALASGSEVKEKKKKKEKPKQKVEIPGTSWTRVTTSEGNVFYFEKENKRSEWTIPEEIKEAVEAMNAAEREAKEREEREKKEKEEQERIERIKERERIRLQIQEEKEKKRKAREEGGDGDERDAKKVKEDEYEPEGEEDQEAWAKAVAAEFADQDAATKAKEEEDKAKAAEAEQEAVKKVFSAPGKVNMSVAEGRALFKVCHRYHCIVDDHANLSGPLDREGYLAIRTLGSIPSTLHQ
jgi:transcription elongation regulator 1